MLPISAADHHSMATVVVHIASQFLVQVRLQDQSNWETYATFDREPQAHDCWQRLLLDGHETRIVEHLPGG